MVLAGVEEEQDRFAVKKDLRAVAPGGRGFGAGVLELFLNPGGVALGKVAGKRLGAAARDSDAHGAVGADAQDVTAGAGVFDELDRNGLESRLLGVGKG